MSDLPILDELRADLLTAMRAAEAPRRPRLRSLRPVLLAALLVALLAATAAAATYYILRASPIAPFKPTDTTPEQRVAPGTSRVLDLRSPDPGSDAPPWALRLARSETGLLCGTVGQVDGDEFGIVGLDGRFRALPEPNADSCGAPDADGLALLGTRVFDSDKNAEVRTVVNGAGGLKLERATIAVRGGPAEPLKLGPEGAFLRAYAGFPEDLQPVVTLRFAGGRTRRYALAASPSVVPDPLGGPAWKTEASVGGGPERVARRNGRTYRLPVYSCVQFSTARYRKSTHALSPAICVQVGRVMDGRFGWVYGDRHFRLTRPGVQDELTACTSRKRPQEVHFHQTTVAFTAPSDPRLVQGVLWGFAPPGATAVAIVGEPGGDRAVTLHGRAYLALIDPTLPRGGLRLRFTFADGRTDITRVDRAPRPTRIPGPGEPIPGTERIVAQTPDPAGGPPWGIAVTDREGGGTCVTSGAVQAIGDQAGGIDANLGLFSATVSQPVDCRRRGGPTPRRPVWFSYGWSSGPGEPDPFLRRARIERRVQTARFELVAECHADVESVTIRSPRDIRTLVPSQRGHVVLAVYDEDFASGEIIITAHLRDGSTKVEHIRLGLL